MRPRVTDEDLPSYQPGRSVLRLLMESAWSDEPGDRPPFSHITTVLRIIAPLKGDQMAKRAFLLQKEADVLEKYIAHDTTMINNEKEKMNDWFNRLFPVEISGRFIAGESIEPRRHEYVTVASFQIVHFQSIIVNSSPDQLITFMNYMLKMFRATAQEQDLLITELEFMSKTTIVSK